MPDQARRLIENSERGTWAVTQYRLTQAEHGDEGGSPYWQEGQLVGGTAMDIPEGRWVDIRLQEVAAEQE